MAKYTTYAAEQTAKAARALAATNGVYPASTVADLAEDLAELRRAVEEWIAPCAYTQPTSTCPRVCRPTDEYKCRGCRAAYALGEDR